MATSGRRTWVVLLALAVAAALQAGCSSGGATDEGQGTVTTTSTTEAAPAGPAAQIEGPLTAGKGVDLVATRMPDLAAAGYVEEEYAASGTAVSYRPAGGGDPDALPTDGRWDLEPDAEADYRTRILVRRPEQASAFNGTVVVEWLNVSGGLDAHPDFSYLSDELLRGGYAWVGVSAQHIGVEGGTAAVAVGVPTGRGLKGGDPERYGDLVHPGDAFSYDLFSQVGRALAAGGDGALGDLGPERLLAVGESQSGFALTTYVNGVHPLARVYDGFLVHSRGASPLPLGTPGGAVDIASSVGRPPAQIRTDLDEPVLTLQTETDVLGFLQSFKARQPDTDRFRLWEVAGTAHADTYLLGPVEDLLDCGYPINSGPHHFVARAALRALDAWVRGGDAPPEAPRLEIDDSGSSPVFVRDELGNVRGGIRTPHVDAPVATLSGEPGEDASLICALMGSTTPIPAATLQVRYGSAEGYLAAYEEAADRAVGAGFVLPEERPALLAEAQPEALAG